MPRGTGYPCALTLDHFYWFKSLSTGAKVIEVVSKWSSKVQKPELPSRQWQKRQLIDLSMKCRRSSGLRPVNKCTFSVYYDKRQDVSLNRVWDGGTGFFIISHGNILIVTEQAGSQ